MRRTLTAARKAARALLHANACSLLLFAALAGVLWAVGVHPTLALGIAKGVSWAAFAGQLAVAGVDVRQVLVRGMLHGFLNLHPGIEPVDRALDLMAGVVAGERVRVTA